jgi:hypothetical protein
MTGSVINDSRFSSKAKRKFALRKLGRRYTAIDWLTKMLER